MARKKRKPTGPLTRMDRVVMVNFGLALHTSYLTEEQRRLAEKGYLKVKETDGLHSLIVEPSAKGERAAKAWAEKLARQELHALSERALECLLTRMPHEELVERRLGFQPAGKPVRWVPNSLGRAVIELTRDWRPEE